MIHSANKHDHLPRHRRGHTLMELVVAMVASAFLLAGLGSVMFIARQVAYTPSDATRRAQTADIVSQICDELRYATIVIQQTPQILEFVVADRNADGTAEKIRYEWSGIAGSSAPQDRQWRNQRRRPVLRQRLQRHVSANAKDRPR